ncbi:MAG: cytidine deaminase [Anaerolineales bacterium]|nr:cytidine deaminase [Anaerolineales bacterium]
MLTDEQKELLVNAAVEARKWAYAPYSHYHVGAAVLTASGRVYDGVNVENAAYPTTICGERVAVFKAVSEGERDLEAIAVVTSNGGTPCGSCRQVLSEFGKDMIVLIANDKAEVLSETTLRELLPGAFGPEKLGVTPD